MDCVRRAAAFSSGDDGAAAIADGGTNARDPAFLNRSDGTPNTAGIAGRGTGEGVAAHDDEGVGAAENLMQKPARKAMHFVAAIAS